MVRGSELELLQALQEEVSVSELAEELDRSRSYTSELVAGLEEKGLVRTRREGRRKLATPAEAKAVELFQRLTQTYPHIDFPELLTEKTIACLYYLDTPMTVTELAERTGNYRNTVNRVVNRLLHRGIVGKQDSRYRLNDDFVLLHEFAAEYVHHVHRQTAAAHATSYTILWESLYEFLVQTGEPVDDDDAFLQTGPNQFQAYGVPLITTNRHHYLYSEHRDDLTVADVICHTLVIDTGTRYQTYCLLLLAQEEPDREQLLDAADMYEVVTVVEDLLTFLETRGEQRTADLPTWSEFEDVAADYGVTV
jgi:predicted transcriptional regulator